MDDAVPEGPEWFTVHLGGPSGGAVWGPIVNARCDIVDDDASTAGTLGFTHSSIRVSEALGSAVFSVTRSGGVAGAVSVAYATGPGTISPATEHLDYEPRIGRLTWNDGEGGTKTFTVPIVDDTVDRGTRAFVATLSAPAGGAIVDTSHGAPECACTIVDDDVNPAGDIGFLSATASVSESAGVAVLTLRRSGGSTGAIGIRYDTSAGTASDGLDYQPVSGWVTWADGDHADKTISVPILPDALAEDDETFSVFLGYAATGGAGIGISYVTVTILDDDTPAAGRVGFASPSTSVVEGGVAHVAVARVGGSTGAVTVAYQLSGDTATAGADFTAAQTGTLSWADGDATAKTIDITAIADGITEGSERIVAQLSQPTGGATLGLASCDVLIADPAPVAVAVSPSLHAGAHRSCGLGAATAAAIALGLALARKRTLGG